MWLALDSHNSHKYISHINLLLYCVTLYVIPQIVSIHVSSVVIGLSFREYGLGENQLVCLITVYALQLESKWQEAFH